MTEDDLVRIEAEVQRLHFSCADVFALVAEVRQLREVITAALPIIDQAVERRGRYPGLVPLRNCLAYALSD